MMQHAANATAGFVGLFLFLGFFLIVVLTLMGPRAKAAANEHALIPFKEETPHG